MRGKTCTSSKNYVEKEGEERSAANQLSGDVIFGDLIWVKLHGSSWWPAQVVDENTVSGRNISSDRSANDVLVRLYGSYKYLYVDPVKCHLEFGNILKENSGNHSEIFKKALEQVHSRSRSGRSNRKRLKFEETRKQKGDVLQKEVVLNKTQSAKVTQRRLLSESTDANGRKRRKDEIHHKPGKDQLSSVRASSKEPSTASESHVLVKNGNLLSEKAKAVKTQSLIKYGRQKKLEANSPDTSSEHCDSKQQRRVQSRKSLSDKNKNVSENKALDYDKTKKNQKRNDQTSLELSNGRKQRAKESEGTNKQRHCGPGSATSSKGKSQELGTRRIKVMQSLGLIAPAGSPFL